MSIDRLKSESLAATSETQKELLTFLGALRRSGDPARKRRLAEKLDRTSGWVSEEEAASRLGLTR